jgi:hypothetical protein
LGIPVLRTCCELLSLDAASSFFLKSDFTKPILLREKHAQCVKKSGFFIHFLSAQNDGHFFSREFRNSSPAWQWAWRLPFRGTNLAVRKADREVVWSKEIPGPVRLRGEVGTQPRKFMATGSLPKLPLCLPGNSAGAGAIGEKRDRRQNGSFVSSGLQRVSDDGSAENC